MLPLFAERCDDATFDTAAEVPREWETEIANETPAEMPIELPTWMMAAMDIPAVGACSADVEQLV